MTNRAARTALLETAADERILVLDGAMGTMIQEHRLEEADYRGAAFAAHTVEVKGNNDLLNLTAPELIREIHLAYLEAGADILGSNTFNATAISQAEYRLEDAAYEINRAGAVLARQAANAVEARDPARPRFVAGVLGPTSRTASISPDVKDPGFRNVRFDELAAAYRQATEGLIDGGADLLMVETIFDTLNARAALFALDALFEERGEALPVMVSGTITDLSGRTLSGQTPEAFWTSVSHIRPFSVGLNCALGPKELRAHVAELARTADTRVSAHPNAGLPNQFGGYDETPEDMAGHIGAWARDGLVNLVGGCCGSRPEHIAAIADAVAGLPPREVPHLPPLLRLSGLEAFALVQ